MTLILKEAEKEAPVAPDPQIVEVRVVFVFVVVLVADAAVVAGLVNVTAAAQVNSAVHVNVMYTRTRFWSTPTAEQAGEFSQLRRDEVARLIADRLAA